MQDNDYELNEVFNNFVIELYAILMSRMPHDTFNMMNNTRLEVNDDLVTIIISGPQEDGSGYDYAYVVNENRRRGKKERKNYHYVEISIKQAARIIAANYGGEVNGNL